jgi:hypothetical protein
VGDRNVRVQLDRAVATPDWSQCFPGAQVQHVVAATSDHCHIIMEIEKVTAPRSQCCFRYELMWEREVSLPEEIKGAWASVGRIHNLGDISVALTKVQASLRKWSFEKFGSINKELKQLRERIEEVSSQGGVTRDK